MRAPESERHVGSFVALIVSHGSEEQSLQLANVAALVGPVIIGENGRDWHPSSVQKLPNNASYVRLENHGLWKAWQELGRHVPSDTEGIFLLNSDIIIDRQTMIDMIGDLRNDTVGITTPLLVDTNGNPQPHQISDFSSRKRELLRVVGLLREDFVPTPGQGLVDIPVNSGAAILVRDSVFRRAVRLRRKSFLFGEEEILALAARSEGLRVVVDTDCSVVHLHGHSRSAYSASDNREWYESSRVDNFDALVGRPGALIRSARSLRRLTRQIVGFRDFKSEPAQDFLAETSSTNEAQAKEMVVILGAVYELDTRVRKTVQTIAAAGWRVKVVSLSRAGDVEGRAESWIGDSGEIVHPHTVPPLERSGTKRAQFRNGLLRYMPAYLAMACEVLSGRYSAILANDAETLPVALLARFARKTDFVIFDAHEYSPGLDIPGSLNSSLAPIWAVIMRVAAPFVDATITVSDKFERMLSRRGFDPVNVVRNAPELRSKPSIPSFGSGQKLYRPLDVVLIGPKVPGRGIPNAISATRRLISEGVPVRLTIIGPGSLEFMSPIERELDGDAIRVAAAVPTDAVHDTYQQYDIALALYETQGIANHSMPNKAFEIMMAGRPQVVYSTHAELAELVQSNEIGTVAMESPAGVADALRSYADCPLLISTQGRNARFLAERRYNWSRESEVLHRCLPASW